MINAAGGTSAKAEIMSQILIAAANSAFWPSLFSVSGFWDSLAANEWAAVVSALVLTIGAVLEYWSQLKALSLLIVKWLLRRTVPFEVCVLKKLSRHALGPILVVLGIAGEVIFEGRTFILENRQERESQATISSLKERTALSEATTAQLRKDASQLLKDAEDEHTARVKIEARVAFRSLNEKQKRDIGRQLSRFGNVTGVSMWFVTGSPETELFADDIAEALRLAHIHIRAPGGIMTAREGGGPWDAPIVRAETGVAVASTSNPLAHELAEAIVKELGDRGFDTKRRPDESSKNNPPGAVVWITVEARPEGPQGEFKLQAEREAKAKNAASGNP